MCAVQSDPHPGARAMITLRRAYFGRAIKFTRCGTFSLTPMAV